MDDLLRDIYAQALAASHGSASVQIHVGTDVQKAMTEWLEERVGNGPSWDTATCWGFPVVVAENVRPDYVAIHTVSVIR